MVYRKWLPLVIPGVLLAAVCAAFFVFNSRESVAETAQVAPTPIAVETTPTPAVAAEPVPSPTATPIVEGAPNAVAAARKSPTPKVAAATPTPAPTPQETAVKPIPTPTVLARIETQPTPKPAANTGRLTAADHLRQGITSLNAGSFAEALNEFEKVRSLAPGNADVFYLIGQAHHRMGQTDQALAAYKQCTSGVYAGVAQNHVLLLEKRKKEKK